jgi:hypothetical protein
MDPAERLLSALVTDREHVEFARALRRVAE